jgi:hypothetical protein
MPTIAPASQGEVEDDFIVDAHWDVWLRRVN